MRSGKVIIAGAFVLVATAALLLRSSPMRAPDRMLGNAGSQTAEDQLSNLDSSVSKPNSDDASAERNADQSTAPDSLTRALGVMSPKSAFAANDKAYLQAPPLSKAEVKSVKTLLSTFFKYQRGKDSLNKLIRELRMDGLDPVLARDFNPYTGKMLTIRTNEALEGTRYFHAQYFEDSDQNKEPFRQHLSFEVRASSDGMQVVKKIVEDSLGKKLATPVRVRGDEWVEWKKDGDSIWIKRIGADDLNNNPLNARSAEDIGSLRIAIEQIPEVEPSEQVHPDGAHN